jgi:hypothetical protein
LYIIKENNLTEFLSGLLGEISKLLLMKRYFKVLSIRIKDLLGNSERITAK